MQRLGIMRAAPEIQITNIYENEPSNCQLLLVFGLALAIQAQPLPKSN